MKAIFIILFSMSFLQSCNYNQTKALPFSGSSIMSTPDTVIDFNLVKVQTAVCLDCHSSGGKKPDLSTKQALIDNRSDILSEVLDDSMPPVKKGYASFTPCEKAALQKWYDLGSPEESAVLVNSLPECLGPN